MRGALSALLLGLVVLGLLCPAHLVAGPKKAPDGFQEYSEEGSSSQSSSASSVRPKRLAGDYGRYKDDFSELCKLVEADGRRMFLYQAILSINVADRQCVDCR
ncbi:MAG: hypothetical protein EBZ48_17055, partial [Proteobacteria bacterium]|nr:hypothetical protein [Pseudomonadota bacterium]